MGLSSYWQQLFIGLIIVLGKFHLCKTGSELKNFKGIRQGNYGQENNNGIPLNGLIKNPKNRTLFIIMIATLIVMGLAMPSKFLQAPTCSLWLHSSRSSAFLALQ